MSGGQFNTETQRHGDTASSLTPVCNCIDTKAPGRRYIEAQLARLLQRTVPFDSVNAIANRNKLCLRVESFKGEPGSGGRRKTLARRRRSAKLSTRPRFSVTGVGRIVTPRTIDVPSQVSPVALGRGPSSLAAPLREARISARSPQRPFFPNERVRRWTPPRSSPGDFASSAKSAGAAWARSTAPRTSGLERPVAIKILKQEFAADPEVADRFMREARTMARLKHPRAAIIFDAGHLADGRPFIVMEYVEGSTLAETLAREGPFAPERAVRVAAEICDVLAEAHALGIVHRDLKPSNIMLNERGVCVLDFGIAKVLQDSTDVDAHAPDDRDRPRHRHAALHVARAVPRPPRRARDRPLQRRRPALRDALRAARPS